MGDIYPPHPFPYESTKKPGITIPPGQHLVSLLVFLSSLAALHQKSVSIICYPSSSLQSVFFSFSLAPASQHRRCPSFLRVGLSSWMKPGGGVDLSWAHFNWTAVHSYIFFFLMGACMCVCVYVSLCVCSSALQWLHDDVGGWVIQCSPRDTMNHCTSPWAKLQPSTTPPLLYLIPHSLLPPLLPRSPLPALCYLFPTLLSFSHFSSALNTFYLMNQPLIVLFMNACPISSCLSFRFVHPCHTHHPDCLLIRLCCLFCGWITAFDTLWKSLSVDIRR